MLIVSLLFHQKLWKYLEAFGFILNPYDPCVANNIIRDKQMKTTWHVDDLKVSHDDKYIVDTMHQRNIIGHKKNQAIKRKNT